MKIPLTDEIKTFCKKEKIAKTITGKLKIVKIDDIILHFYRCENDKCNFKTGCAYIFPKVYYKCLKCGSTTLIPPRYLISPVSRSCHKCCQIVTEKIPPNVRLYNE